MYYCIFTYSCALHVGKYHSLIKVGRLKKKARFSYPYFEKHVNKIEEQRKNKILDITILRHLWSTKAQYTNSQS